MGQRTGERAEGREWEQKGGAGAGQAGNERETERNRGVGGWGEGWREGDHSMRAIGGGASLSSSCTPKPPTRCRPNRPSHAAAALTCAPSSSTLTILSANHFISCWHDSRLNCVKPVDRPPNRLATSPPRLSTPAAPGIAMQDLRACGPCVCSLVCSGVCCVLASAYA